MLPSVSRDFGLERCRAVPPKSFSAFFLVRKAASSVATLRPFSRPLKVGGGL
jgi:hypothetical protein